MTTDCLLIFSFGGIIFGSSYILCCLQNKKEQNMSCFLNSTVFLLLNSIQMRNGYWKNSLCLWAASTLKWSVFSQFFTELHTTLLKDPSKTKSGLWELTEALKRLLLALLHASTEIETSFCPYQDPPFTSCRVVFEACSMCGKAFEAFTA